MKPKDLEFLLADLAAKVEHKLLPSAAKRRFPLTLAAGSAGPDRSGEAFVMLDLYDPLEVAKRSVSLTKRLCAHLESVSGYFQQLIESNDGLLDASDMFSELAARLARCYQLCFRILNRIFSWHGFLKSSGAALREDGLRYLASRTRPDDAKTAPLLEVTGSCFSYIEKFSGSIPTFSCAVEHAHLAATLLNHLPEPDPDLSEK